jgi:phosphoadenosine phosphosulfate reductase
MSENEGDSLESKLQETRETISWAINEFEKIVLACSFGKDSITVLSLAREVKPDITVFWIKTGYAFKEIVDFKDRLVKEWDLNLVEVSPRITKDELEEAHGKEFYKEDPKRCCECLKVEPTRRFLSGLDAWMTGLRRDETEHRDDLRKVERLEGMPVKINPIVRWTADDIWDYITTYNVPYNTLYDKGFVSLGCEPCTRACSWGRFERAGRWPDREDKECGMHTIESV